MTARREKRCLQPRLEQVFREGRGASAAGNSQPWRSCGKEQAPESPAQPDPPVSVSGLHPGKPEAGAAPLPSAGALEHGSAAPEGMRAERGPQSSGDARGAPPSLGDTPAGTAPAPRPALGRCCHLPAPPHRPYRLSVRSPGSLRSGSDPHVAATLSPCLASSLHLIIPISLISTPLQPFTPPFFHRCSSSCLHPFSSSSLQVFIPASLPLFTLKSPHPSIPALSLRVPAGPALPLASHTVQSPKHSHGPAALVQLLPILPGRELQSRGREGEFAFPTAPSPPKQAEEGGHHCDTGKLRHSPVKCAAHRLGLVEAQNILCPSSQAQLGSESPLPLQSAFPHTLAAAGITTDPQSPLRAKWHLTSSFEHAMENNPGELREKGDMEIPVRTLTQLRAVAQHLHLHHAADAGLWQLQCPRSRTGRQGAYPHRAQGVPMGLRTSSQLHALVLIPTIQSQHQACKHPAWKSTFPSPRVQAGAALHNVYRSMFSFLYRKKLLLDPGLRILVTSHPSPPLP